MTAAEQNRLIASHMELVAVIAAGYRGGSVEFEELLGIGREGLVKAARSFDPTKSKFSTWATTKITTEMMMALRSGPSQWFPKDEAPPPLDGDKIEKIYEYDAWGEFGNAMAISEAWVKLGATPEELAIMYDELAHKRGRFAAAFISLTGAQRKLVKWVYLDELPRPVTDAARELGISYFQATRLLKKALKTMREVISRMEAKNSGGNIANRRPSLLAVTAALPGTNAA